MAAVADPNDPTALAARLWIVEQDQVKTADKASRTEDRVDEITTRQSVHDEQISTLKATGEKLAATLDKVLWALIGLALTIAGSAVGFMFTVGGH